MSYRQTADVSRTDMSKPSRKKPEWLKVTGFSSANYSKINKILNSGGLKTVCHEANCPNRGDCFTRGTATFLILGPTCSRNCRFCDVRSGPLNPVDPTEPARLAQAAVELGLKHIVLTSVTRDDLPDGGAGQFSKTVEAIREALPKATIELLTPDFRDCPEAVDLIIKAAPEIFNHNVETVPRLYPVVRPQADYQGSLKLLQYVYENSGIRTKSGLMVGLGETRAELRQTFQEIAEHSVSMLTIGQYLAPSSDHLPVERYLHPDEFDQMAEEAKAAGIELVLSAPLVRSSYHADMAV
ncbi:MAG: lipoyl synthase [bacterium]|nr:lipoyl synthase [bacterium]